MNNNSEVVVVGAGLAGLCCARTLKNHNICYQLLDASDQVGGRIRTDVLNGFRLDRGFQVLQTAYPEAQKYLSYAELKLHKFFPGAVIRFDNKFYTLADPFRNIFTALGGLFSPVGTLKDKLLIGLLRFAVTFPPLDKLLAKPEVTTLQRLRAFGFSSSIVERFFKPLYAGIFLENNLLTSSRAFDLNFRMAALGDISLPSLGMESIPRQLAQHLDPEKIHLNDAVVAIHKNESAGQGKTIQMASGKTYQANKIVLAVNEKQAALLLKKAEPVKWKTVKTLYFAAIKAPTSKPILFLNAEGKGPVINLSVPSNVCKDYAPPGQSLISCSVLNYLDLSNEVLIQEVLAQMKEWFGSEVENWSHLRTYNIEGALPNQEPSALHLPYKVPMGGDGIYCCGDYLGIASQQGAMQSGRQTGEVIIEDLKLRR